MKNNRKKILIAPLNWGLGHAVRDIPLIYKLIENNFEVMIAGEGASGELLKKEFPELKYIPLSSFSISYSKNQFLVLKLFLQIPKIIVGIRKEHSKLQDIIKKYNPDIIISDNRYGLYSDKIPSIFISHQIFPVLPKSLKIFEKIIYKIHQKRIQKFDKCLIPDFKDNPNLSGNLSHKYKLPDKFAFIGILSQFEYNKEETGKYDYDIAVILSGPEPQRTIFENIIKKQLTHYNGNVLIVSGKPDTDFKKKDKNITSVNHLTRPEMQKIILSSEVIISRAGYTTIMDLVKLKKSAILVPTPGQTEQEYLADYLKNKDLFVFKKQCDFNLKTALKELELLDFNNKVFAKSTYDNFIYIVESVN